jgi:hypothetical protein
MDFDYLSDPERRILHAVVSRKPLPVDVGPDYARGLARLGYLRLADDAYAIGNTFLEQWLSALGPADWASKSNVSAESTRALYGRGERAARRESILRQLKTYRGNLDSLLEEKAQYGIGVPIHVLNQIKATEEAIARLEQELSVIEGDTFGDG